MLHNHGWETTNSVTKRLKTQKGSGRQRNPTKKSCRGSKGPFLMYMAGKKTATKFKPQKQ